jgi:hypothetical protein
MAGHPRILAVTIRQVTLRQWQAEPLELLDAAERRAAKVVDPELLGLVRDRIAVALAGTRPSCAAVSERELAVCSVVDQTLLDVAGLDDATVGGAAVHFADGELADLVMASYIIEARTRLQLAADRLLGGAG